MANHTAGLGVPALLSLLVVALDRVTKLGAERYLDFHTPHAVYRDYVRLVLWYNEGAAFGLRLGGQWVHVGLSLVAMVLVGYLIWQTPRGDRLSLWGFALIIGGAIGNLWDRLTSGRVTDFIDLGVGAFRWPTFNVADSVVVVGIGLLLIAHLSANRSRREHCKRAASDGERAAKEAEPSKKV